MGNHEDFMKALRAERQHELRVAQAQGLQQRHQAQPDTRLVPLPPAPMANFFPTTPAWISQIEHHLFTPELNAAIDEAKRTSRQKQQLFGEAQRITKEQLITKRAMRRLNHLDDNRGKV